MFNNENYDVAINDTVVINDNNVKTTENEKGRCAAKMPSKGGHLAMVIFGFMLGALWGGLSIAPYVRMKNAIEAGDEYTARENAKKVKIIFFIGLAVNVLFILFKYAIK